MTRPLCLYHLLCECQGVRFAERRDVHRNEVPSNGRDLCLRYLTVCAMMITMIEVKKAKQLGNRMRRPWNGEGNDV